MLAKFGVEVNIKTTGSMGKTRLEFKLIWKIRGNVLKNPNDFGETSVRDTGIATQMLKWDQELEEQLFTKTSGN